MNRIHKLFFLFLIFKLWKELCCVMKSMFFPNQVFFALSMSCALNMFFFSQRMFCPKHVFVISMFCLTWFSFVIIIKTTFNLRIMSEVLLLKIFITLMFGACLIIVKRVRNHMTSTENGRYVRIIKMGWGTRKWHTPGYLLVLSARHRDSHKRHET